MPESESEPAPNVENPNLMINGIARARILDANTFEAHIWLAQRALEAEELQLASAHIRLARELQNAIVNRGTRARIERSARREWNTSPSARREVLNALDKLRDRCARCGRPGEQRTLLTVVATFDDKNRVDGEPRWVHIDSLGYELRSDHPFTLHV